MSKQTWLGVAERLVLVSSAIARRTLSTFDDNSPEGWRYWLIHFANSYRGRQEYNNDILHQNSTVQAHFGRSGLDMLAYDPRDEGGTLYLFDSTGRASAKEQLMYEIPRLVSDVGDAVSVGEFYENIYNATPAHKDDIHSAIMGNPDLR